MGYEYKIKVSVTDGEKEGLSDFIQQLKSKSYNLTCSTPLFTMQLEEDGLYICQFLNSNVWQGMESLRQYLAARNLKYRVEEL